MESAAPNLGALRTIIITGANSGLGEEAAKILASNHQCHIIYACRDKGRAEESIEAVKQSTGWSRIEFMQLDLGSLDSVRAFAKAWKLKRTTVPPLRALVCNAGLQQSGDVDKKTSDGFELSFGINHLGHFLLINLMYKFLVCPARIVIVSSGTHDPARKTGMPHPFLNSASSSAFPWGDPEGIKASDSSEKAARRAYTTSKLANVYCGYELVRRLERAGFDLDDDNSRITVSIYDPGLMLGTGLVRAETHGRVVYFMWKKVLPLIGRWIPGTRLPEVSGQCLAALAFDDKYEKITGRFYDGHKDIPSSTESYNKEFAEKFWEDSKLLVKMKKRETKL
jgi:NAD(P)-dependent dehydrogenase (short-subunit alcohol dehydrogenase family)